MLPSREAQNIGKAPAREALDLRLALGLAVLRGLGTGLLLVLVAGAHLPR